MALRKMDYSPYIDELKESGFTEKQARGVARFQHDVNNDLLEHVVTKNEFNEALTHLATKNDLKDGLHSIRLEINELKTDFKWFKFITCGIFMMMVATLIKLFIH